MLRLNVRGSFRSMANRLLIGALLIVSLAALTVLSASHGRAATGTTIDSSVDWHQWQGPNRDALSTDTGLLKKWPTDGPPLLWTCQNLGKGFSGISIQNGRIFTMGDRDDGQYVDALNLADGKPLWTAKIGPAYRGGPQGPGPHCTPAADGLFVYALGTDGDLACLSASNGKLKWALNIKKDFGGITPHWGISESPLVDGDRLICTPGGKDALMVALNKLTGKLIWRCAPGDLGPDGMKGAGYSSVVISTGGGVKQYVQLAGKGLGLVGVRASDGKLLWHYNKMANATADITTPIVRGDYVFDSTAYKGGAALVKLSSDGDGVKAEEVYFLDNEKLANHHGGMVLVGDYLYGGHGQNRGAPLCIEFLTGKIKWKENHGPEGTSGSAAVGYADGKLYFRYDNGVMALLDCTPDGYKLISQFKIPDQTPDRPSWPHPVIAGGKLYLREQDHLLCYDLK